MFVEAVFKSTFGFSYIFIVTVVTLYHGYNVFVVAVTVNAMINKSSFAGRIKCILSKSTTTPLRNKQFNYLFVVSTTARTVIVTCYHPNTAVQSESVGSFRAVLLAYLSISLFIQLLKVARSDF